MLARDLGVSDSHSDYCKFIILGKGRSGSNFLRSLLDSHGQILTFGEIFRRPGEIGWGRSDYNKYFQSPKLVTLMRNESPEFIEKKVFGKFPRKISAVGFKIFYQHAHGDAREAAWTFLKNEKDLKVIHLKRRNILKRLVSYKKALVTNEWKVGRTDQKKEKIKVSLTYEECLQEFLRITADQEKYDDFFKNHPKIELIYENLSSDRDKEMKRVQSFLGVDDKPLKPSTRKQSYQPLSDSISNYFELKEKFGGTPWESFFED